MEERDLEPKKKEIVEINKNQKLKLLKFTLLVGIITQALEWVIAVSRNHKIVKVTNLNLDLLVANLLRKGEA